MKPQQNRRMIVSSEIDPASIVRPMTQAPPTRIGNYAGIMDQSMRSFNSGNGPNRKEHHINVNIKQYNTSGPL